MEVSFTFYHPSRTFTDRTRNNRQLQHHVFDVIPGMVSCTGHWELSAFLVNPLSEHK